MSEQIERTFPERKPSGFDNIPDEVRLLERAKKERYAHRDKVFLTLNRLYMSHPRVTEMLGHYCRPSNILQAHQKPNDLYGYLDQIRRYKILTKIESNALESNALESNALFAKMERALEASEETALIEGVAAYQTLYHCNLRLVYPGVRIFLNEELGMNMMDLIQEGNVGLGKAIRRFNYQAGTSFSTYAMPWIRATASQAIADQARVIRAPIDIHQDCLALRRRQIQLETQLGHTASLQEIADAVGDSVEGVEMLQAQGAFRLESVEQLVAAVKAGTRDDRDLGDVHKMAEIEDVEDEIDPPQVIDALFDNSGVSFKGKAVLALHFGLRPKRLKKSRIFEVNGREFVYDEMLAGLATDEPMTLEQVGGVFGVTKQAIHLIEKEALEALHGNAKRE